MAFEQDLAVTAMTCSGEYRLREYVGDDAYLETKDGKSLCIIDRWGQLKDVLPAAPTANKPA